MNVESMWERICDQISEMGEEFQTTTGLWFLASSGFNIVIINKAVEHEPSCRIVMERIIPKEEFLNVYPYYEPWIKGKPGIRQEARDISQNTSYIFALIEYFVLD